MYRQSKCNTSEILIKHGILNLRCFINVDMKALLYHRFCGQVALNTNKIALCVECHDNSVKCNWINAIFILIVYGGLIGWLSKVVIFPSRRPRPPTRFNSSKHSDICILLIKGLSSWPAHIAHTLTLCTCGDFFICFVVVAKLSVEY